MMPLCFPEDETKVHKTAAIADVGFGLCTTGVIVNLSGVKRNV
jgi:hypothetical protein